MNSQRVLIGLLLLLLWIQPAAAQRLVSKIAVVVNDEVITTTDIDRKLTELLPAGPPPPPMRRQQLWAETREMLIDEMLMRQRIAKLNLSVSDEELERAVADVAASNRLTPEQLQAAVAEQGLGWAAYRDQLRQEILSFRLIQKETQGLAEVTNHELRQHYLDHQDDYRLPPSVQAGRLSFPLPAEAEPAQKQRRAALEAQARLVDGADFAALLAELKAQGVADGGDTGKVALTQLSDAFSKAIAPLKPGEVSQLLEIQDTIHLLVLMERLPGQVRSYDEVKDALRDRLLQQKRQDLHANYLKTLRQKAYIDIRE